jgi:hypothetical protein
VLSGALLLGVVGVFAPHASADDDDPNNLPPSKQFLRGQYLKGHVWRGGVFDPSRISPFAAPAGAHLTYYGGRVVSNMQVVQVLYGTGSYNAQVAGTSTPNMGTFYQGVLNSLYVDWLTEYNTTTQSGTRTNQTVGRGSFLTRVTITPSAANNGSTIDDTNIQAELAAQINAGHLPAPSTDAAGNNNTYYAVFFPPGKTITQGGSSSCVSGGFCAYHGTIASVGGHEIYYGIHPDMQAGSGCATGCGSTGSVFGNYTQVASHEMIETITDAEVGLATVLGPPLAWYDNTNGEIGDICNGQGGTVVGNDGVTYNIQLEFSNVANNCIATRAVANDFSISASPTSLSVLRGGSGTSTISTAITSGSAQTISLSASGAPSGVTISFSPASVSSGGSSTMTATASATATTGTFPITITGTAASGSHTTSVSLTVTAVAANDFSISASPAGVTIAAGSSGSSTINTATTSGSAQTVNLSVAGAPSGVTATLTPASVTSGQTSTLNISTTSSAAAGTYTLTITGTAASGSHTAVVTLTVTSGGGGSGITNGGFETGNLSGWTAGGASETVSSSGCHGGTYCAELGSTSPTNGDSTISQTFTAPAGTTGISFWYKETCPDTVTYDWALATLQDNTAGTTATLLAKTCATNAWVNGTGSVTAGHSYTLSLTNHDDNYAGDPTYTLYDDVALTSSTPPPSGITNGGFESGTTGWTTAGTTSILTTGCHGGTSCARAGSTSPTNGDSSFIQTFTIPTGKTQLSAWYKMTCPDTVTYDWATITLKNNTGGSTATVLPKTCSTNSSWVNVTTPVTAGSSYTLTLTSHDDNYSADPSFTLFDDIVLN